MQYKQFATFYFNNKLFGVDIRLINEVNPSVKIVPVPLSEPHIRGVINIRGQIVMVIEFPIILGNKKRSITKDSHIIILKTTSELLKIADIDLEYDLDPFGNKPIGLLVDKIGDIALVKDDDIKMPAQYIKKSQDQISNFLSGVVKINNQILIIINPAKVLEL